MANQPVARHGSLSLAPLRDPHPYQYGALRPKSAFFREEAVKECSVSLPNSPVATDLSGSPPQSNVAQEPELSAQSQMQMQRRQTRKARISTREPSQNRLHRRSVSDLSMPSREPDIKTASRADLELKQSETWVPSRPGQNISDIISRLYSSRLPPEMIASASTFVGIFTNKVISMALVNAIVDSASPEDVAGLVSCVYNLFSALDVIEDFLREGFRYEVNNTIQSTTLFRGNNLPSRLMTLHTKKLAQQYMEEVLTEPVRKIVQQEVSFEIDPSRTKAMDNNEKNQALLEKYTQALLNRVYLSVDEFPRDLKRMYVALRQIVSEKFPGEDRLVIANFLFLRFFNPFIVQPPHRLMPSVSPKSQRNLMLVSKLVQLLANGVRNQGKEDFMHKVSKFINSNIPNLEGYVDGVTEEGPHRGSRRERYVSMKPTDMELENSVNLLYNYIHKHHERLQQFIERHLAESEKGSTDNTQMREVLNSIIKLGNPPLLMPSEHLTLQSLASSRNLASIAALKMMFVGGKDADGSPTLVFNPATLFGKKIDMESLLLYFVQFMATEVQNTDYLVLWIHAPLESHHRPSLAWIRQAYQLFDAKMKKNVKHVLILRPSIWFRILIGGFRPFLSGKFWVKLRYLDSFNDLTPYFPEGRVPDMIKQLDGPQIAYEE